MMIKSIVLLCTAIFGTHTAQVSDWNGKWFPFEPNKPDLNPKVDHKSEQDTESIPKDPVHGVAMGVRNALCDNGQFNLEVDWYKDPVNYTCFEDKRLYLPKSSVHPLHSIDNIPKTYTAIHKCLNESIEYSDPIPTFGVHRPLWAMYGEYTFLPKQRWLHNLEHGAVVMLYHPCAAKFEVKLLKELVKSCLYKHVITPYDQLTAERPLALLTWGHRLEISKVFPNIVVDFIRNHALKGPEKLFRNGQYNLMLTERAKIVSTFTDSVLCPKYKAVKVN